jgi:hypothetical protein
MAASHCQADSKTTKLLTKWGDALGLLKRHEERKNNAADTVFGVLRSKERGNAKQ